MVLVILCTNVWLLRLPSHKQTERNIHHSKISLQYHLAVFGNPYHMVFQIVDCMVCSLYRAHAVLIPCFIASRTCFHPPSRAGRYSTGIFYKKATQTLKITNHGTGNLAITISVIEGTDFSIKGSSNVTTKPKKIYSLQVIFKPTSTGLKTTILRLSSNDPDSPTIDISLSGTGQ